MSRDAKAEETGPTLSLEYDLNAVAENPISSFMYFIPLISRTPVERLTTANNAQQVAIISYDATVREQDFHVVCEFEITGEGFHQTTFCPAEIIASRTDDLNEDEPLTRVLDYIRFEGEGFGRIEVSGTISGSTETVMAVDLKFNGRGRKSPVTIGLYDLRPKNGLYEYENRSREIVARVNRIVFTRSESSPTMDVSVESISASSSPAGFFARVKGVIANLFLTPPKIDQRGNETMLDFGYAIFKQNPRFTFPKANNIKEDRIATDVAPDR